MKGILVQPGCSGTLVDISPAELERTLGYVSFAYPFDDPVCLVHDDDGIANHRLPNRTINGIIMPGPFYVLGMNDAGQLMDLSPQLTIKYLQYFEVPEYFPVGRWNVITNTIDTKFGAIISIESKWEKTHD